MSMKEEWVSMRAAAARLKAEGFRISANKVSRLANREKIRTRNDPLDERVRLVELNELRALFAQSLRNSRNDGEIDEFTDDSSPDDE